jgi:hypothetical protein
MYTNSYTRWCFSPGRPRSCISPSLNTLTDAFTDAVGRWAVGGRDTSRLYIREPGRVGDRDLHRPCIWRSPNPRREGYRCWFHAIIQIEGARPRSRRGERATAASSGAVGWADRRQNSRKCPSCVGRGPIWAAHFVWENGPPRATPIQDRSPSDGNGQVNLCTQNFCPVEVGGYM